MFARIMCPVCGQQVTVAEGNLGQRVKCPNCQSPFVAHVSETRNQSPSAKANPAPAGPPEFSKTMLASAEEVIRFSCPRCGKALEARAETGGHKLNCPGCRQRLQVPLPAAPPLSPLNKTMLAVEAPKTSPTTRHGPPDLPSGTVRPAGEKTLLISGLRSNKWILVGGGMLAGVLGCLLILAVWKILTGRPNEPIVFKEKDKESSGVKDNKDRPNTSTKDNQTGKEKANQNTKEEKNPFQKKEDKTGTAPKDKKGKKTESSKVEEKNTDLKDSFQPFPFPPVAAPRGDQAVVGQLVVPDTGEPVILLQGNAGRSDWKRLGVGRPDVFSGRHMVSLPGSRAPIKLNNNLRLTLWGYLPEIWPIPPLYESAVEIHFNDQVELDLTLSRGRILITNLFDRAKAVRLRFDNPQQPEKPGHFDITLGKKSEILVDRWSGFTPDEPFYKDPKHSNRKGPVSQMILVAMNGEFYLKFQEEIFLVGAPPRAFSSFAFWGSYKGILDTQRWDKIPEALTSTLPVLPRGADIKARLEMLKAYRDLSVDLSPRDAKVEVALKEALGSPNLYKQRLAVRCYAALDDKEDLMEILSTDSLPPQVHFEAMQVLRNWIATSRDAEYQLYGYLQKRYPASPGAADILMELFHYITPAQQTKPETWENLIQFLNNKELPIRELAYLHLYALVPAGGDIRYSPVADEASRLKAQEAWRKVIPPGKLPRFPRK